MSHAFRTATAIGAAAAVLWTGAAQADPPADPQAPPVFCFRITDIERLPGDLTGATYCIEFEVLNWTDTPAAGVALVPNIGGGAAFPGFFPPGPIGGPPTMFQADVDPDGRGGTIFSSPEIGPGVFDVPAIHSGRGRGDVAGLLNDWSVAPSPGGGVALWNAGTRIPNRDLLGALATGGPSAAFALVPGLGTDALGDTAIDGGPAPYSADPPGFPPTGGPVVPDGSGNVLDGFVIYVCDWHKGEVLSFNWYLLDDINNPIGVVGGGNAYGFGTVNIVLGPPGLGGAIPPIWTGGSGFGTNPVDIFDDVGQIFDQQTGTECEFYVEFGAGQTAPVRNPNSPFADFPTNAEPTFEAIHPCVEGQNDPCPTDFDGDGETGASDLSVLLANWGLCDPFGSSN